MKLYLVEVSIFTLFDCDIVFDTSYYSNVYSSFEQAKEEGLKHLKTTMKDIEENQNKTFEEILKNKQVDYIFNIIRNR